LLWHGHLHRDHGLAVFEIRHDGCQIGAADQGEQPLFVVADDARCELWSVLIGSIGPILSAANWSTVN
jgi:hypothetical protein